ncbi:MAG: hypothetical protein AVDCRST_MAG26-4062 [uncultured Chloroflexia bacterium]|uniref:Uncharacterized protein n=1 Tax=uncultured Chloroflexia bacterium TaxID=1672391 RepID=A0A6J4JYI9_9CHLR|nr:MAG: hypothetical protein AVDCRST_MAG26-4062 [uncultured Chloroflexia bacterium]
MPFLLRKDRTKHIRHGRVGDQRIKALVMLSTLEHDMPTLAEPEDRQAVSIGSPFTPLPLCPLPVYGWTTRRRPSARHDCVPDNTR